MSLMTLMISEINQMTLGIDVSLLAVLLTPWDADASVTAPLALDQGIASAPVDSVDLARQAAAAGLVQAVLDQKMAVAVSLAVVAVMNRHLDHLVDRIEDTATGAHHQAIMAQTLGTATDDRSPVEASWDLVPVTAMAGTRMTVIGRSAAIVVLAWARDHPSAMATAGAQEAIVGQASAATVIGVLVVRTVALDRDRVALMVTPGDQTADLVLAVETVDQTDRTVDLDQVQAAAVAAAAVATTGDQEVIAGRADLAAALDQALVSEAASAAAAAATTGATDGLAMETATGDPSGLAMALAVMVAIIGA